MKSILISIKPKHCANILNGLKTREIRKRFPKDYRGWVYIYCTKEDSLCCIKRIDRDRYICGKDFDIKDFPQLSSGYEGKGKVVARFYCDDVDSFYYFDDDLLELACIDREQALDYLGKKEGYAINISNLEIFDTPKELNEFYNRYPKGDLPLGKWKHGLLAMKQITKAPQSWCYCETDDN